MNILVQAIKRVVQKPDVHTHALGQVLESFGFPCVLVAVSEHQWVIRLMGKLRCLVKRTERVKEVFRYRNMCMPQIGSEYPRSFPSIPLPIFEGPEYMTS